MMKKSTLPKGVITKLLGDTRLVRTLTGHLKTQDVITMQDFRLPKFDKNKHINQQKDLVFDKDNVKFLSKTGIKLNYLDREHGMV
jgi:hypothetical protein